MHKFHQSIARYLGGVQTPNTLKLLDVSRLINVSSIGWYNHAKNDPEAAAILDRIVCPPFVACEFKATLPTTRIFLYDWELNVVNYEDAFGESRGTLKLDLFVGLYKVLYVERQKWDEKETLFGIDENFVPIMGDEPISFEKTEAGLTFYQSDFVVGNLLDM